MQKSILRDILDASLPHRLDYQPLFGKMSPEIEPTSHTDARRSYWVVTHSSPTNVCWGELHDKTKELLHVRLPGC